MPGPQQPIGQSINNRLYAVMLHKTTTQAYLTDAAIPNSQTLHSTSTKKLQKHADPKEELTRIRQMYPVYAVPLASPAAVIVLNKLHDSLKLLSLRTAHVQSGLKQKAVIFNTRRIGLKVSALQ
jgi:hypothetical protein